MLEGFPGARDVQYPNAYHLQRVGDQRPMALPPERLRTHDRYPSLLRQTQQPSQTRPKLRSLHVVRVSPEGKVPPSRVMAVRARCAPPAEFGESLVADTRRCQLIFQHLRAEVRMLPGSGEPTDVGDDLDPMCEEQRKEGFGGIRGVAYRPDRETIWRVRSAGTGRFRARVIGSGCGRLPSVPGVISARFVAQRSMIDR